MKILIINQHVGNHGDEAAGKALMKGLRKKYPLNQIGVIYNIGNNSISKGEEIGNEGDEFIAGWELLRMQKIVIMMTFVLPFFIMKKIIKKVNGLKLELNTMESYDKIINSPGGVNIGPYKNWLYLWRLYVAVKLKKDVGIYSISFGPLPDNIIFKNSSQYILKNVDFLSLRDKKSQKFAEQMNLDYVASIDTAFLVDSTISLPSELERLSTEEYIVVVPNELYRWHPSFLEYSKEDFDNLYVGIIEYFLDKKLKVYLLPQLFGSQNDTEYFKSLKKLLTQSEQVEIIDENYSSDVQQQIIKHASFLVGARYHSIIFAINNKTPFFSLAYEHKMTNTLEILNLSKNNVDLKDALSKKVDTIHILNNLYVGKNQKIVEYASKKAREIALITMNKLYNFIDNKL